METSYYDSDFKKPLFDSRNDFYYNQSSSRSSVVNQPIEPKLDQSLANYDEFSVEFFSSKPIEPNDLEIILLFLENSKKSGGGDFSEYILDPSRHLLILKYENTRAKSRVLSKKTLTFQQFKLIASEPFDEKSFKIDDKTVILTNVSEKMNAEAVTLFAENLVVNDEEANDVESVSKSIFFSNVYFVTFKMSYNHEKIIKRLARKSTMFDQTINLLQGYSTRSILVKKVDRTGQPLVEEFVELYFSNKKRCGVDTYLSMRERHPFWLITFEDQASVEEILKKKHSISQQELLVERLISFVILQEGMKLNDSSECKELNTTQDVTLEEEKEQEAK